LAISIDIFIILIVFLTLSLFWVIIPRTLIVTTAFRLVFAGVVIAC